MRRIVVITFICFMSLIAGVGNYKQLNNVKEENGEKNLLNLESNIYKENIISNIVTLEEIENDSKENDNSNSNKIIKDESKDDIKKTINNTKINKDTKNTNNENNEKNTNETRINITANNLDKKQEDNKKEEIKVPEVPKTDIQQQDEIKEHEQEKAKEVIKEFVYNSDETDRMINAVNEVAKRNVSLWDEEGKKLYEVESNKKAMNENYFSPYRLNQIEAKVLNAFPVKVLVYAVDYTVNGVVQETRYYITLEQL